MKLFAVAITALFLGYLLGGLAPSFKLQDARDEIVSLQKEIKEQARRSNTPLSGVNQLLDIREEEKRTEYVQVTNSSGSNVSVSGEYAAVKSAGGSITTEVAVVATNGNSGSFSNQLEMAANAWGIRAELAKNAFVENVKLDESQTTRFHILVEAMNIRLENTIRTWVDTIKIENFQTEESGVRILNELSEVLVLTYDEMDRNMPEGWRETAGKDFNLTSLIDPDVAKPLAEVEEQLKKQ